MSRFLQTTTYRKPIMKMILTTCATLAVLAAALLAVTGCNKSDHEHSGDHAHQYTCPMKEHADVVSDQPGKCPKCGMKLVEKH